MLDDAYLVMYDAYSYSTRDAFIMATDIIADILILPISPISDSQSDYQCVYNEDNVLHCYTTLLQSNGLENEEVYNYNYVLNGCLCNK